MNPAKDEAAPLSKPVCIRIPLVIHSSHSARTVICHLKPFCFSLAPLVPTLIILFVFVD